ncbi:MAG: M23 family metallopeptidase [Spirochaetaceae bacterium]|jgi:murein DD-endopeptidase MepM/ murein hydrolase activator NlpD|nr:M23 family metallopeptidase [Spirochaetaceae bacterium]
MTNDLILQQYISRRKPPAAAVQSKTPKAAAYMPRYIPSSGHSTNALIIEQIKQRPVQKSVPLQHYYKKKESSVLPGFSVPPTPHLFSEPGVSRPIAQERVRIHRFPVARLLPILAVAGLLLFILLSLNWAENPLGTLKLSALLPWGTAYRLDPGADEGIRSNLATYAGLSTAASDDPDEIIPLNLVETFAWESYKVKKGDSVSKIATQHALSIDAIVASNYISNAKLLREGDVLRIPNMDGIPYTVKKGDALTKIASAMGVPLEVILDANDIQSETLTPGKVLFIPGAKMRSEDLKVILGDSFIYPIRGRLTSPFGWRNDPISGVRRYHAALDLAAATGTPIKAAMDGRISTVGVNSVFGKYIIMSHTNGYQTMYAHMSAFSVTQGAMVTQGTKIGEVGSTGYSTGPHLHFAIFKNGRAVNPLDFLK